MSNPLRGEAAFVAGDETYTLVFDINALCHAEAQLDRSTDQILADVQKMNDRQGYDFRLIRGLVWAGLQAKHPCHVNEAGEIIASAGAGEARVALMIALMAAFGIAGEGEDGAHPPKPSRRKARAGTG